MTPAIILVEPSNPSPPPEARLSGPPARPRSKHPAACEASTGAAGLRPPNSHLGQFLGAEDGWRPWAVEKKGVPISQIQAVKCCKFEFLIGNCPPFSSCGTTSFHLNLQYGAPNIQSSNYFVQNLHVEEVSTRRWPGLWQKRRHPINCWRFHHLLT